MKMLASNDHLGMFEHAVSGAANTLEKVPIPGQVWAAELKLATAPVTIFAEVADAFVQRGKQLMQYSGELSSANAQADVRSLLADIREAQDTGPDLARLTDAQSRASDDIKRILEPIKEFIINRLANIMEKSVDFIEWIGPMLTAMEASLISAISGLGKVLAEALGGHFADAIRDALKLPAEIAKDTAEAVKKFKADKDDFGDFVGKQLDDLDDQLGPLPGAPILPPVPPGGGFGGPGFGG